MTRTGSGWPPPGRGTAFQANTHGTAWYAAKSVGKKHVFMHNVVMPPPAGRVNDHRNRNRLDNRKANLRPATRSENKANCLYRNATGFRGVRKQHHGGYQAMLRHGGRRECLGTFRTAAEAARVYDSAAAKAFGEFAVLNFGREAAHAAP